MSWDRFFSQLPLILWWDARRFPIHVFMVTTPNIMTGLRDIFQHCFLATEPNKPLPDPSGFRALPSPILFSWRNTFISSVQSCSLLHRSRWSGYYHGEEQNYPQLPSCFTSSHTAHMLLLFLVKWREPLHSLHVCFCLYSCFIVIQPYQLSDNINTAGCIPPPWPPISV